MGINIINNENFESEVLNHKGSVVVVDFWANWCVPCKNLAPIIEEIAEEEKDIKVCKVDVDEAGETAMKYSIMSIPTVMIFKDGEVVERIVGAKGKEDYLEVINSVK